MESGISALLLEEPELCQIILNWISNKVKILQCNESFKCPETFWGHGTAIPFGFIRKFNAII